MSNINSISRPSNAALKDLTGQVFTRWTVKDYAGKLGKRHQWTCVCACGTERPVDGTSLRSGLSGSCGCLRLEVCAEKATTHGGVGMPEYRVWEQMWKRCTDPKNKAYPKYKSRVPADVFKDFGAFFSEVGPRPSPDHSLDREDNSLGYIPGNLRWVTRDVQANNTDANIPIRCVATGEVLNLKPACREVGIPYHRVYQRMFRLGWSVAEATEGQYCEV